MKFQRVVLVALVVVGAALAAEGRFAKLDPDQACRDYAPQKHMDVSKVVDMIVIRVSPGDDCQGFCQGMFRQIGFPYAKPNTCCCGNIGDDL